MGITERKITRIVLGDWITPDFLLEKGIKSQIKIEVNKTIHLLSLQH